MWSAWQQLFAAWKQNSKPFKASKMEKFAQI
jgi:hypothetical protein